MVSEHPRTQVGQLRGGDRSCAPISGWVRSSLPVVVHEWAGLHQHRIGHADLAHVVEYAGHAHALRPVPALSPSSTAIRRGVAAHGAGVARRCRYRGTSSASASDISGASWRSAALGARRRARSTRRHLGAVDRRSGPCPGPWPRRAPGRQRASGVRRSSPCSGIGGHPEADRQPERILGEAAVRGPAQALGHQEGARVRRCPAGAARTPPRRSGPACPPAASTFSMSSAT